jgi:hypothetical protein
MELYVLSEENVEEVSERTGRSVEQLLNELLAAQEKGTVVHYYFDLPEL